MMPSFKRCQSRWEKSWPSVGFKMDENAVKYRGGILKLKVRSQKAWRAVKE